MPVKFIVGDLDITYNAPGVKEYKHSETSSCLQDIIVMKGVAHFLNQERPDEITAHIYDFIKKFHRSAFTVLKEMVYRLLVMSALDLPMLGYILMYIIFVRLKLRHQTICDPTLLESCPISMPSLLYKKLNKLHI